MLRLSKFLLFFLLCLAIALVVNLPLPHLLPHFKLPPGVSLSGIDGTVVSGELREVRFNRFPLRQVKYRFEPSCLPLLKVCYGLEYEQGGASVAYDLLNGDTEVNSAHAEYTVDELTPYLPPLLVEPEGRLELEVEELRLVAGKPAALAGQLTWRGLGVRSDSSPLALGDYRLKVNGEAQNYALELNDLDAVLDVDGEGDLQAGGQYSVDIKISSAETIDSQVRSVLDLFATRISPNNYRLEQQGRLPPRVAQMLFK